LGLQCPHCADQFHSAGHVAEGGEALAVGIAPASKVQLRLIADTYEEGAGSSRAYRVARNRNRPVAVPKPGETRRFVSDGGEILAEDYSIGVDAFGRAVVRSLYRGIGESPEFRRLRFHSEKLSPKNRDIWRRYLGAQAHMLSDHVVLKTPLDNIRITTFIANESKVKIVDPTWISLVEGHGCVIKFIPPTEYPNDGASLPVGWPESELREQRVS
jgi:hypothetical protein